MASNSQFDFRQALVPVAGVVLAGLSVAVASAEVRSPAAGPNWLLSIGQLGAWTAVAAATLTILFLWLRLRQANRRAEEAEAGKRAFLTTMSHEVRTPLNGIIGMSELLLNNPLATSQREICETIQSSGRQLLSMVQDVLEFSELETGRFVLGAGDFHVEDTIREALSPFRGLARAKNLALLLDIAPEVPERLHGDQHHLAQILKRLVDNAIKFTEQGWVHIRVRAVESGGRQHRLWFEVEDTGIGIAESVRRRLFEPFTQLDTSTTRRFGGTGLGLAISSRLVKSMDGSIGMRSQVGKGSQFWFTARLEASRAPQPKSRTITPRPGGERLRVLLVEDNAVNQRVASALLYKMGHTVELASNGEEAVEKWRTGHFDIVVMDCQMPVMDGYAATAEIRRLEGFQRHTWIVAMTAQAMAGDRERCLTAGMDDYVSKPVALTDMRAAVDRMRSQALAG